MKLTKTYLKKALAATRRCLKQEKYGGIEDCALCQAFPGFCDTCGCPCIVILEMGCIDLIGVKNHHWPTAKCRRVLRRMERKIVKLLEGK